MPCDNGEGRVKRGAGDEVDGEGDGEVDAGEAAAVDGGGVMTGARVEVAVAVEEEEEADPLRWCGFERWLGLGEPDAGGGGGVLRAEFDVALEPVLLRDRLAGTWGGGTLWLLWPLWLLFVLWRWLPLEFTDEVEPEASGRM